LVCSGQKITLAAPAGDGSIGRPVGLADPELVASTHWICGALQVFGMRGSVGKQVNDFHAAESPGFCKTDTTSNRRIILVLIGG